MAFHEVLFPPLISYGSAGGPKFKTTIFTADSGFEQRNIDWKNVRCEYDVSYGIKKNTDMDEVRRFFMARRGKAYGFRFFDHGDHRIVNQVIALGDGVETEFQIVKSYTSAQTESGETYTYSRPLTKIGWDTVENVTVGGPTVLTEGADYDIDYNTGKITFADPPYAGDAIKIGAADFHVPVRFDTDHLDITQDFWLTESWPNIPLVEVRDWGEAVFQ